MTVNFNPKTLEAYWLLIRDLNEDARLELASRLINSLKLKSAPDKKGNEPKSSLDILYGAWSDEKETAEEMIELLQKSRLDNLKIVNRS